MYTVGCQTGTTGTTRFDNRLNEQWLLVQHGCQTGCQTGLTTGLTTGWMFVYTIQPVETAIFIFARVQQLAYSNVAGTKDRQNKHFIANVS